MIAKFDLRELLGDRLDRLRHQEADTDDQVVVLLRERREVRHVVGVGARDEHASLDAELLLGALEPLVRKEVEGAVVESADVRDEPDLDRRPGRSARLGRCRRRGGVARVAAVVVAAAACEQRERRDQRGEQREPEQGTTRHLRNRTGRGGFETHPSRGLTAA